MGEGCKKLAEKQNEARVAEKTQNQEIFLSSTILIAEEEEIPTGVSDHSFLPNASVENPFKPLMSYFKNCHPLLPKSGCLLFFLKLDESSLLQQLGQEWTPPLNVFLVHSQNCVTNTTT